GAAGEPVPASTDARRDGATTPRRSASSGSRRPTSPGRPRPMRRVRAPARTASATATTRTTDAMTAPTFEPFKPGRPLDGRPDAADGQAHDGNGRGDPPDLAPSPLLPAGFEVPASR